MQVRGNAVLLTGAPGCIGHAIARRLRAEGAGLVLTGRRVDEIPESASTGGADVEKGAAYNRRGLQPAAWRTGSPWVSQQLAAVHRNSL
jgi:NAD(P)-dependent dehydrogenase (short-subunit alcohol dehydrogenase family)